MAAAVADYRPKIDPAQAHSKVRRHDQSLTLTLEPTPDLLAEVAANRRPNQLMVGFALEPREELADSARAKLVRKKVDLVVGNPLETMDSETIDATLYKKDGTEYRPPDTLTKQEFASWLLDQIGALC